MATSTQVSSGSFTDQYSTIVLIASVVIALLTFPIGVIIPVYLYIKADRGEAKDLSTFEIWTVILLGIFGIAGVEIAGSTGAKIAWLVSIILFVMSVLGIAALSMSL